MEFRISLLIVGVNKVSVKENCREIVLNFGVYSCFESSGLSGFMLFLRLMKFFWVNSYEEEEEFIVRIKSDFSRSKY